MFDIKAAVFADFHNFVNCVFQTRFGHDVMCDDALSLVPSGT